MGTMFCLPPTDSRMARCMSSLSSSSIVMGAPAPPAPISARVDGCGLRILRLRELYIEGKGRGFRA